MNRVNDTNFNQLQSLMFKHMNLIKQFNQCKSYDDKLRIVKEIEILRQQIDEILNNKV